MTRKEVELELNRITEKSDHLLKEAELGMSTVKFLSNQADSLMKKCHEPDISFEETQHLAKQMESLLARMRLEERMIQEDNESNKLEARFNLLSALLKEMPEE